MLFEDYTNTFEDSFMSRSSALTHLETFTKEAAVSPSCMVREDEDTALDKKEDLRANAGQSRPHDLEPRPIGNQGITIIERLPVSQWFVDDSIRGYLEEWSEILRDSKDPSMVFPSPSAGSVTQAVAVAAAPPSFDPFSLSNLSEGQAIGAPGDHFHYDSPRIHATSNLFASKGEEETESAQIHQHQVEKWSERYSQLKEFYRANGHSVVPYHYKAFPPLAWWVKRQRHAMRLKQSGQHHTMTEEREQLLNGLDFVWDTRAAVW